MNQCPEDRPMTDPSVLERQGWICEADQELERALSKKRDKKAKKPEVPPDDGIPRFYCHCRQVCSMFFFILTILKGFFLQSFDDGTCLQVFKMNLNKVR